jgi:hypothetical protein
MAILLRHLQLPLPVRGAGAGCMWASCLPTRSFPWATCALSDGSLSDHEVHYRYRPIEAQKAAEAALITRREETAAVRSQANTARLMEQNPTLMRLREIEALERVADKGRLSVVVGEGGLAGRIVKIV